MTTVVAPDRQAYDAAFADEVVQLYPVVDAFEAQMGFAIDHDRLITAARVLACPVKAHAPNWQHGRVLYAAVRAYCETAAPEFLNLVDIGTAKGFSALCLQWALTDANRLGDVTSCDVIDPKARQRRNTVGEVDGLKTLAELLEPWPEATKIAFRQSTGVDLLSRYEWRVHVAFVDGKHSGAVVRREGELLAMRQNQGDLVIFDDVQIPGVEMAVRSLGTQYEIAYLDVKPERRYAIGRRK